MDQVKGRLVRFKRQTREMDRDDEAPTEHYIIEAQRAGYMGYLTVRRDPQARELAATVLVSESGLWATEEAAEILRAIESYAFDATQHAALSVEVGGPPAEALKRLEASGFTQRASPGTKLVAVKARGTGAPMTPAAGTPARR